MRTLTTRPKEKYDMSTRDSVLAEVSLMIRSTLGLDNQITLNVTEGTTLVEDLGMESIDIVDLGARLASRYGPVANFATFFAELDIGSIATLRVGDMVEFIVAATRQEGALE
jgi:acyl carrier protein